MQLIIFLIFFILFLLLSFILPKFIFKISYYGIQPNYKISKVIDNKFSKVTIFDYDDSRFIKQYAMIQKNGYKEVVCKVSDSIKTMTYDVVLFSENGDIFNIISVKDKVSGEYTNSTKIPDSVSSVMIVLKSVNDNKLNIKFKKQYKRTNLIVYSILMSVIFYMLIYNFLFFILKIYADVFYEDIITSPILIILLLVGCALYSIILYLLLAKRKFD